MNKREAKIVALEYLATRAEEQANPLMGDDTMPEEDNEKVYAAFEELAVALRRRIERLEDRSAGAYRWFGAS